MSFISKITGFFKGAAAKAGAVFVKIFGSQAAHDFAQSAEGLLKSALGQIAQDAVASVASLAISGADKRASAFNKLTSDAKNLGLSASEGIYNLLIELAVQRLKQNI